MLVMARTFERLLRDQTRGPLCFVVVVPAWNDSEAFRVMSESCFKRLHFTLAKVRKTFSAPCTFIHQAVCDWLSVCPL
jgi:hypothetical protein